MSTPSKPEAPTYAAPRPTVPQAPLGPVLWYNARNSPPSAAIVTKSDRSACKVMVFPEESRAGYVKEGVRHVSDPEIDRRPVNEGGMWDYTEEHKLLLKLAAAAAK